MDVVKISGIKCDNTEFDYRDDSVLFEDYHNWFNKPYPKEIPNEKLAETLDIVYALLKQMGENN